MLKLLFLFVAQPHFAECGCLCVDGVPKTLCQNIAEAQRQPNVCPLRARCPAVDTTGADADTDAERTPQYFDAPAEQAHSCREVRIWDGAQQAYTGVKICDVFTS